MLGSHVATEADVPTNTKTRKRAEDAAADQATHEDSCSSRKVYPDLMCRTSSGDDSTESPALPCFRDDAMVDKDAAAPKLCLSLLEMRTLKAIGGLFSAGTASTATRTIFHQLPLWFFPTEEMKSRTPTQYATTYYSSFRKILERNEGKLWCSTLAVVHVLYAPARFWENGARCFVGRFSFGRCNGSRSQNSFGTRRS